MLFRPDLRSPLLRNALWTVSSQFTRVGLQAIYFVLVARSLGPTEYGLFVSTVAGLAMFGPFVGLGSGYVLIERVSRDRLQFASNWGASLALTAICGLLFAAAVTILALFLSASTRLIMLVVCLALAELFFARLVDVSWQAFQSVEKLSSAAVVYVFSSVCRVGAAFLLVVYQSTSAEMLAVFYLFASATSAVFAVLYVCRAVAFPSEVDFRKLPIAPSYSLTLLAQSIRDESDKFLLAYLGSPTVAGTYAAAARIVDVTFVPIRGVVYTVFPRFFRHGLGGIGASGRYALRVAVFTAVYAVPATILVFILAPFVPLVLGTAYRESAIILRYLAPLILIRGIHYFAGDALAGAGFQRYRSVLQIIAAAVSIGANLLLIPAFSWRGAAAAALVSATLLAVLLIGSILLFSRRSGAANEEKPSDRVAESYL